LRLHSRGLAVCVWGAISHWSGCRLTSAAGVGWQTLG
jgi:hypothetical protein